MTNKKGFIERIEFIQALALNRWLSRSAVPRLRDRSTSDAWLQGRKTGEFIFVPPIAHG
jgi:hypothetical protein